MARRDPNSIRGRIRAIAVGESDDFKVEDRDTVRAAAYDEGVKMNRKYIVKTLKEQNIYRVTRDQDPTR